MIRGVRTGALLGRREAAGLAFLGASMGQPAPQAGAAEASSVSSAQGRQVGPLARALCERRGSKALPGTSNVACTAVVCAAHPGRSGQATTRAVASPVGFRLSRAITRALSWLALTL